MYKYIYVYIFFFFFFLRRIRIPADRNVCSVFRLEPVTSLQRGDGRRFPDAALMSGRGGLWSMYVSGAEGGGGEAGVRLAWDRWSWLKPDSGRPTLPVSCLRFISILSSVTAAALKRPMKAWLQTNAFLLLFSRFFLFFFYGPPQMIDFIRPPLSFISPPFFLRSHSCVCFEMPREKLTASGLH